MGYHAVGNHAVGNRSVAYHVVGLDTELAAHARVAVRGVGDAHEEQTSIAVLGER